MPTKINSGVIRKPPPMPNIPEMKPTASPMPEDQEDVDGQVSDGEIDLHAGGPAVFLDEPRGPVRHPRAADVIGIGSNEKFCTPLSPQSGGFDRSMAAAALGRVAQARCAGARSRRHGVVARGRGFGLVGCAAAVARSQPPGGPLMLIASSGSRCGLKVCAAKRAAVMVCWSSRVATSSRFLAASLSPVLAASANHL